MSDLMKLVQEADVAALEMEQAKSAVEAAKLGLEAAKEALEAAKLGLEAAKEALEHARKGFDEILMKADELGIPRPKVRKLIEERTMALVASGLIFSEVRATTAKAPRAAPKASRKNAKSISAEDDDAMSETKAGNEVPFDDNSPVENTLAL